MADAIELPETPTGYIPPSMRNKEQNEAHAKAVGHMPKFAIAAEMPTGPVNVRLFDRWKHPDVVADVGFVFDRFHQITGSCVGAGGGNALFSLIALQRTIAENPTVAFLPFWPFNYGKSRLRFGWKTPGEGSFGSTFADSLRLDGVLSAKEPGLPQFTQDDGLLLTRGLELQWSDGDTSQAMSYNDEAIQHPLGSAAELKAIEQGRIAMINGYPQTFACNYYVGRAGVKGTGESAALVGRFDTYGPHQTSIHAVWDNPQLGPLWWYQNNWPKSIYPKDPAGGPTCGCWLEEAELQKALRSYDAEWFALSHLDWFPAQPKVLDWFIAP